MSKRIPQIFLLMLMNICISSGNALAQQTPPVEGGFQKYDRHTLSPYISGNHQLLFSLNYTQDLDLDDPTDGNLDSGHYAGIGLGYLYKFSFYELPQNFGVGAKAEYFPGRFYKFNFIFETDLLMIANEDMNGIFLSGMELNMTYNTAFTKKEAHQILYLLEINYRNYEVKWGLQSWWDKITPIILLDEAFNVIKLTYKLDVKK